MKIHQKKHAKWTCHEFGTVIYLISDEPYRELAYKNAEVPYPTKYYDTTFENKNNNITVEEIVENLKVLNDDIEKMTIADKKNKTIKKILSIFVILIAIILNIILYKSSLLLGIITSIILLSIYFFFKENYQ